MCFLSGLPGAQRGPGGGRNKGPLEVQKRKPTNKKPGRFQGMRQQEANPAGPAQPNSENKWRGQSTALGLAGLAGLDPAGVFRGNYVHRYFIMEI